MNRGSPNIEMDEHTFMVNRERAVDYLNSLDKVVFSSLLLNLSTTIYFNLALQWNFRLVLRFENLSVRTYISQFFLIKIYAANDGRWTFKVYILGILTSTFLYYSLFIFPHKTITFVLCLFYSLHPTKDGTFDWL